MGQRDRPLAAGCLCHPAAGTHNGRSHMQANADYPSDPPDSQDQAALAPATTPAPVPLKPNTKIVQQLRAAAAILEAATSDNAIPEIVSVGVNGDEITIQPWQPGAPVQAIRAFEALMNGPIDRRAFPLVLEGAHQVSALQIKGTIDDSTVVVTAATYRDTPVDGFLGVTEQAVAALAAQETPITDPADAPQLGELLASRNGEPPTIHTEPVHVEPMDAEPDEKPE